MRAVAKVRLVVEVELQDYVCDGLPIREAFDAAEREAVGRIRIFLGTSERIRVCGEPVAEIVAMRDEVVNHD